MISTDQNSYDVCEALSDPLDSLESGDYIYGAWITCATNGYWGD